jgi:hypothetical protein
MSETIQTLEPEYLAQLQRGAELSTRALQGPTQGERFAAALACGLAREASDAGPRETMVRFGALRTADGSWWVQVQGVGEPVAAFQSADAVTLVPVLVAALELLFAPMMGDAELASHREALGL